MPKLSVIGLDGVNWKILEHAIDKGLMPNFEKILDEGARAELETTYPPVTGPAWTSIMTGDNPATHGVFDFVNHVEGGRPYSSQDIETETVYEKIAERGDVAVVNLPLSYPPRFKGEFVGSFLAPEDDYVFPEELKQRYDFSDYKKSISAIEKSLNVVESSSKAARDKKELMDEIMADQDFFYLLFSAPDWIMHNHYHRMEKGDAEEAFEVFRIMDDAIGTAYERSDNLILLSDHGFHSFDKVFYVNRWLHDHGYLETRGAMGLKWSDNRFINAVLEPVSKNRFTRRLARKIYTHTESFVPLPENVKVRLNAAVSEGIDLDRSEAFCPSSGIRGVYINDGRFEGVVENPEAVREKLMSELPEDVKPVSRDNVFEGPELRKAPDVVFEERKSRVSRSIYREAFGRKTVNHHGRRGFFYATGENFESRDLGVVSLYDVAPTIAELFELDFEADGDPIDIVSRSIFLEKQIIPDDF